MLLGSGSVAEETTKTGGKPSSNFAFAALPKLPIPN